MPNVSTTSHAAAHAPACMSHEQGKQGHIGDAGQDGNHVRCIFICRYRVCAMKEEETTCKS